MTLLVVSPHLDDAVLSVPVRLRREARAGHRVVVATLFSEGRDGALRREEDRRALVSLGCEPRPLGLWDAPERRGLVRNARSLLLAPLAGADPDVRRAREELDGLARELRPGRIWLPLGVGEHVDHRVAHAAGRALRAPVAFYEDRPYACVHGATAARLHRLGAGPAVDPDALAAAGRAASFARAFLPRGRDTEAVLRSLAGDPAATPPLADVVRAVVPTAKELDAALQAVAAYASQLPDLFGGLEPRAILADPDGIYRERLHELRPSPRRTSEPARGGGRRAALRETSREPAGGRAPRRGPRRSSRRGNAASQRRGAGPLGLRTGRSAGRGSSSGTARCSCGGTPCSRTRRCGSGASGR